MEQAERDEKELRDILIDLAVEKELIEFAASMLKSGKTDPIKNRLLAIRAELLFDIHISQNKLYSIDYVLRKIM